MKSTLTKQITTFEVAYTINSSIERTPAELRRFVNERIRFLNEQFHILWETFPNERELKTMLSDIYEIKVLLKK